MDLKEKLISSFLVFENQTDIDSPIHDVRSEAIKTFEEKGFPTKKEEAWKYTSLNSILKHDYSVFPKQENALEYNAIKKYFIHDIDTFKIVFIDGKYSSHLSQTTHDGMDICLMSSALAKPKYRILIENYFNKIAAKDSLSSLDTAFSSEGAYIHIPKYKLVQKPILIILF
jgi:Fe-S cluster assembly protein SufD